MLYKTVASSSPIETGSFIKEIFNDDKIKAIYVCDQFGYTDLDFWEKCASSIGTLAVMEEDIDGNKTNRLFTDIKYPWHEISHSFSHSNTRQPLHTDGSYESNAPEITFFSCKESPKYGGETIFVDGAFIQEILSIYFPVLFNRLKNEIVVHKKGSDFKQKPIIKDNKFTWNYYRCEECSLREDFNEFLEKYIIGSNLFEKIKLSPGDALFFKDEDILHGRTSFLGNRWLVKGGIYVR